MAALAKKGMYPGNCRDGNWELHMLPASSGAVCLDGSPAGFYYFRAPPGTRRFPATNQSWMLFFEGGGWCVSEEDCAVRALGHAGSSSGWSRHTSFGGVLNKCCFCTSFCTYHRVVMKSCDGSSFAGATVSDVSLGGSQWNGHQLPQRVHFAGRAIVAEVLRTLISRFGLGHAHDVLVAGCSAGGLAALLMAESIRATLLAAATPLLKFKVLAFSGLFFVPPASGSGSSGDQHPFALQMAKVAKMAGIDQLPSCRGDASARCLLGTAPLEAVPPDVPVFIVQSPVDTWQLSCVLGAATSDSARRVFLAGCASGQWSQCTGWMGGARAAAKSRSCPSERLAELRAYQHSVADALRSSPVLTRAGSGAYVHSCGSHCEDTDTLIYTRIGDFPIKRALQAWFRASPADSAATHTRFGCLPNWGNRTAGDCAKETCGGARLESLPPPAAGKHAKETARLLRSRHANASCHHGNGQCRES